MEDKERDWIINYCKEIYRYDRATPIGKFEFDDAIQKVVKAYADGRQDITKYKKMLRRTAIQRFFSWLKRL